MSETAIECRFCGEQINEEQPFGFWVTDETTPADIRRHCDKSPDHLHAPEYEPCLMCGEPNVPKGSNDPLCDHCGQTQDDT